MRSGLPIILSVYRRDIDPGKDKITRLNHEPGLNWSDRQMRVLVVKADFSTYRTGTTFSSWFSLAGFRFKMLEPTDVGLSIGEFAGEQGLSFPHPGLRVDFTILVGDVTLRVGSPAAPIRIRAFDTSQMIVNTVTVQPDIQFVDVHVGAPEIAGFFLDQGADQGILAMVQVIIPASPAVP